MITTVLKPIKEEERQPSPNSPELINDSSRCNVGTETENESFSVDSIPLEMLEYARRNLKMEVEQLEYEFRQLKEALYNARCTQVNRKLEELKRSEAPELDTINDLVDSLYNNRKQVAKYRRDLQLESANKEYDNAIQTAMNDYEENIRNTRERLRDRFTEAVCNLQVEFMMVRRTKRRSHASSISSRDEPLRQQNAGLGHPHHYSSSKSQSPLSSIISRVSPEARSLLIPELFEEEERTKTNHRPRTASAPKASKRPKLEADGNGEEVEIKEEEDDSRMMDVESPDNSDYLPGPDLEPRRKPVTLPANTPCFIYNLAPEEIDEDLKQIDEALKILLMRIISSKRGIPRITYSETASFIV
nr:breast cancer metastasis suppressor 1 [Hymenolepis microstoma]